MYHLELLGIGKCRFAFYVHFRFKTKLYEHFCLICFMFKVWRLVCLMNVYVL